MCGEIFFRNSQKITIFFKGPPPPLEMSLFACTEIAEIAELVAVVGKDWQIPLEGESLDRFKPFLSKLIESKVVSLGNAVDAHAVDETPTKSRKRPSNKITMKQLTRCANPAAPNRRFPPVGTVMYLTEFEKLHALNVSLAKNVDPVSLMRLILRFHSKTTLQIKEVIDDRVIYGPHNREEHWLHPYIDEESKIELDLSKMWCYEREFSSFVRAAKRAMMLGRRKRIEEHDARKRGRFIAAAAAPEEGGDDDDDDEEAEDEEEDD